MNSPMTNAKSAKTAIKTFRSDIRISPGACLDARKRSPPSSPGTTRRSSGRCRSQDDECRRCPSPSSCCRGKVSSSQIYCLSTHMMILRTCDSSMPYSRANTRRCSPARRRAAISHRWEFVTFDRPLRSPLSVCGLRCIQLASPRAFSSLGHSGDTARPFTTQSWTLSACVPRNRCFGLQHGGTSQWCRTFMPFGIGPLNACHASR